MATASSGWAADPQVTNVRAQQLNDGSKRVEVLYDLTGAPSGGATVSVAFSSTGNAPYGITPHGSTLSGHIGAGVANGSNRRILWDASTTLPAGTYGTSYRAAVTAVEPAGQTGDISFRLQWTGSEDLDLYVREPSGEVIYHGNRVSATGGQLDVDANFPCSNQSPYPTENIFWPVGRAPSGTYGYWVNFWDDCANSSSVSFTIDVLVGTEIVETVTGTLTEVGENSPISTQLYSGGGGGGGEITITLPGGVPMVLVRIPAGTFMMGSPTDERGRDSNEDLHQVTLTQDYYIGKYEVTQRQWQAIMGSPMPASCGSFGIGSDYPVYCVSWDDICGGTTGSNCTAGSFIGRMNDYLATDLFRLPTEAEWERAARGGTQTEFSFPAPSGWDTGCGSFPEALPYMWWCNNAGGTTHQVGTKQANPYELHDMHGNLIEWVADWYETNLGTDPVSNPPGPSSGSGRVVRGGSWGNSAQSCRSAFRYDYFPSSRNAYFGFRLARSQ